MRALDQLNRSEPAVSQSKTKKGGNKAKSLSRRAFLRSPGAVVGLAAASFGFSSSASGRSADSGLPEPDEAVDATLKRLFGNRSMTPGEEKIKLELPLIAEDGGNVAISVDANLPVSGANHLHHLGQEPAPDAGQVFIFRGFREGLGDNEREAGDDY